MYDADDDVRRAILVALGNIGDAKVVDSLVASLRDKSIVVVWGAQTALKTMGKSVVPQLVDALKDPDSGFRENVARLLAFVEDSRAADALMSAWKAGDLAAIAGGAGFFVARGEPGTEKTLLQALEVTGSPQAAAVLLNSGNPYFDGPVRNWARIHGYEITQSVGATIRWGSRRKAPDS
jgi:HEAT repeat protein